MPKRTATYPDLVIASAGTASNSARVDVAESITIYAPAALTGTVNVQASPDGTNWYNLQDAGSDIAVGVDDAVTIVTISVKFIRLLSSLAEGAERTFKLTALEDL